MRRWVNVGLILVVVAIIGLVGVFARIDRGMCGSAEVRRLRSPDAHHDAVLYQCDCGATTGFSTHVAIVGAGAPTPHGGGNVLSADDGNGAAATSPQGVIEVELRWLAVDTLLLRPDPKAAVFKQASIVQGVHIVSGASGRGGA
jgi:hypothetical protein